MDVSSQWMSSVSVSPIESKNMCVSCLCVQFWLSYDSEKECNFKRKLQQSSKSILIVWAGNDDC